MRCSRLLNKNAGSTRTKEKTDRRIPLPTLEPGRVELRELQATTDWRRNAAAGFCPKSGAASRASYGGREADAGG